MVAITAIRRIEVVGASSGLDETRTKLEAVARAQTTVAQTAEGMAVTTEQSARRQLSAASNYDRLRRSIDETFRTEQRYAQGQSIIERAFEQGHIQAAEYARSLQLLADKHGVVSLAAARQTAELQRAAEMQARINAMTGVTGGSDSASRGADIEAYGQALTRLQAKYDPVFTASERYKASLVEIDQAQRVGAISIEIATQARLKSINSYNGEISALERVGAARKSAAQAMVDKQTITPDRGADIAAYGRQLDDLRAKYSPLYAAGRQYKETLVEINTAAKVGALTETERAAAVQQTKAAFVQQVTSLKGVSTATGDVARQSGLAGHELVNLSRQAQDVVTMFAMGASPMQIFSSQAAQIFDIFASSKGTLAGFFQQTTSWLGNFLTAGRLAFGGVALSIGAAALALNSYLEGQRKVQMSLVGAGRSSGQTVGSLNAIAQSSSSSTGLSVSEARAFAAELASTGKIGRDNLEPLVKIGHDIAMVYGIDAAEAAKMLGKAYADPVRGAEDLNDRLGFLDAAMQRQIQTLVAQNRVWEAQRVLQAGVESGLVGVREATATTTKFWTALGNEASNAWEKIGAGLSRVTGIGLKLGLDDQLKVAKEQLASFQKDLETAQEYAKSLGPDAKSVDTGYDAAIAGVKKYTAEVERLTASLKLSEGAAEAAQDRQRSFAQEAAMRTALPEVSQLEALKNQTVTLQGAVQDTRREIANLVPDEATGARLTTLTTALDLFNKALDKSQAATRGFKTEFQRLSEGNAIALDAVTAFSPKAKADIAKRQAELTYSQDPNAAKLGQDAYNLSLKQSVVALSEAARARDLYARQSENAAAEEIKMVGQTVGKQAEMRANLQARQALEQQLLQTHEKWGPQQEAELARLAEINRRYGEQAQLLAKAQINDQIKFDRATIGLSQEDVQIAQQLRSIYPDVATALGSTEAAGLRLNTQMREARDISTGFANDLVSGLVRGDDAMKALTASAASLVAKLSSQNVTRFMQGGSLFGSQSLMSGAGALGMAGAGLAGYQSGNMGTGAMSGALAGATFGPVGAVVGGAIGFLGGLFGGNSQKREQERKEQEAAQQRQLQLSTRTQMAGIDQSTRQGSLAALEIQFQAERMQEAQNGNRAIAALESAQNAERLSLQKEWDKREIELAKAKQEAIDARALAAQDRLFAALNDSTSLEGQLAAADRQFLRERLEEMKAGGEAINDLVAAQEAERIDIIKRYNDDLVKFVQGVAKTIRQYLESLKTGPSSVLSPQQQLAAAQSNFQAQLTLARGGDRDALSGITQVAQTLLDQAKSFYASSGGYTDIYGQVTAALQGLADVSTGTVSDNDKLIAAINESKTVTTGTIQTTSLAEQSLLGAINVLADRFVAAINGLGQITSSIGSIHSGQLAYQTEWLALIAKGQASGGGTFWSWLGFKNGGVIPGYATGGIVGNGVHNVDSVLASYAGGGNIALAGGEYVMPAGRTAQYRPELDAMRRGLWANDNQPAAQLDWQSLARALKQVSDGSDEALAGKIDQLIDAIDALPAKTAAATRRLFDNQKPRAA